MSPASLSALSRPAAPAAIVIPRPGRRIASRILLPALILLGTLAALAYAAREHLRPAIPVHVAPVVPASAAGIAGGANTASMPERIVQAPGWIEADPYAIGVAALAPGVIQELPVLEGQRIEPGQVVARLVDDDARLAHKRALADADRMAAAVRQARSAIAIEEARTAEAQDAVSRIEPLAGSGAVAEGEISQLRLKLASQRAAVEAARSAVLSAQSEEAAARVAVEQAALTLTRMEVHAPIGGVVLQRLVEPGQRVMPDANNPFAGVVVRLYDPQRLQIRVDIPLADAAAVHIGDTVEVSTETLPDRIFHAKITRFVHEANSQKNTVQIKAAIADPAPELKPEMLAKARISTRPASTDPAQAPRASAAVLLAPRAGIIDINGTDASAWVIDQPTSTATKRRLKLGRISTDSAEVLEGLRLGDRLILSPSTSLTEGAKVKQTEDAPIPHH